MNLDYLRGLRVSARSAGHRIVGTFHSHPISEAVPSPRDLAEAAGNSLLLIYDVCGAELRLWRVVKKGQEVYAKQQELQVGSVT